MTNAVAEYESLFSLVDGNADNFSVKPRWQRKKEQAANAGDRFIANRGAMDSDHSAYALSKENADGEGGGAGGGGAGGASGADALRDSLLTNGGSRADGGADGKKSHRVLAFTEKPSMMLQASDPAYNHSLKVLHSAPAGRGIKGDRSGSTKCGAVTRHIPSAPTRVLDAPDLLDDYYLNLVSWSRDNIVAVALGATVYLWDAASGGIEELTTLAGGGENGDDYVSSLGWIGDGGGAVLAVGTAGGATQLWDATAKTQVRSMGGHSARVGALAWSGHNLASGSRDATVVHHDVRIRDHAVATLRNHTQEVCGLAWSPDGALLASGGNDNQLNIWDAARSSGVGAGAAAAGVSTYAPKHTFTDHCAAVKALAWCPFERHVLASGGGTADRCIRTWQCDSGAQLSCLDTGAQVTALAWNPQPGEKELLSAHGFAENQLVLWKYPTMARVKELKGHTARVLALAVSPDGGSVLSAGADETLRFWDVFGAPSSKKAGGADPALGGGKGTAGLVSRPMHIR